MLAVKILGVFVSLLLVFARPTEKKDGYKERNALSYKKQELKVSHNDGTKSISERDNDGKSSTSIRYRRSPYQHNSSRPTETSKPYKFDYLIENDFGDLIFRREEGFPNGTVSGFYGHSKIGIRYLIVNYTADGNGYRATVQKAGPFTRPVVTAQRGPDGITYKFETRYLGVHYDYNEFQTINEGFQYQYYSNDSKEVDDKYN